MTDYIRYHAITTDDMKNGNGLRVVLWVAGCNHCCKGCQNPFTQDVNGGKQFDEWEEAFFWESLKAEHIKGATFSGGDPLHPANRDKIGQMCVQIKEKFPKKDIWLYTGYRFEERDGGFYFTNGTEEFSPQWLPTVDVIVDGPFQQEIREEDLKKQLLVKWRGDSSQRVIDVKETLKCRKTVILKGCEPKRKE